MKLSEERGKEDSGAQRQWLWIILVALFLVALVSMFRSGSSKEKENSKLEESRASNSGRSPNWQSLRSGSGKRRVQSHCAEQIVASKVAQFGKSRREFAHALAKRHGVEVPSEVERFFDAVESGKWEDIDAAFNALGYVRNVDKRPPEVKEVWAAIMDAYGAAEQAHLWPAQKLLDYGNAILDSLRPGMIYVGGTDAGRWVPELLNDTSGGERHIIVTQNGLADNTYLEYLRMQYGDRIPMLTDEDSQHCFQDYITDAQKRFQHDQQFPDEPKQVLPGEEIAVNEGHTQVSGQVAVMMINEHLLQALMQKNPDASFALQESFPFKSTYGDATPLGPIMELRAQDGANAFTPELAAQSVEYWRGVSQKLLSDPDATSTPDALKNYSKDISSTANLLAARSYSDQAEQAFNLARQLWPDNPEPTTGLARLLASAGRLQDAQQLLDEFTRAYPDRQKDIEKVRWTLTFSTPAK